MLLYASNEHSYTKFYIKNYIHRYLCKSFVLEIWKCHENFGGCIGAGERFEPPRLLCLA